MTKPFWEGLRSSSRGPIPVLRAGHSGPDRDGGHLSAPEAHLDRLVLNLRVRCRTMRADTIGTNIIAEDAELHAEVRRSSQVTKATEVNAAYVVQHVCSRAHDALTSLAAV